LTTSAEKPTVPVWVDGLGLGWILIPFLMWLSASELWASMVAFAWLTLRVVFAVPFQRRRLLIAFLLGLCFEVALWRTGACLYQNTGILYVPLWILPLWAGGGLLIAGFAAPSDWERPERFIKWLALIPFALNCVLPSSWVCSLLVASLAIIMGAFLWRDIKEPSRLGRAVRIFAVGLGGTSASWTFGIAGICIFPQAWYGIPPWGLSLWTSLAVVVLAFRK
jgi:hypothetical protein